MTVSRQTGGGVCKDTEMKWPETVSRLKLSQIYRTFTDFNRPHTTAEILLNIKINYSREIPGSSPRGSYRWITLLLKGDCIC